MTDKETSVFEYLNNILNGKTRHETLSKDYKPFLINRGLSLHVDALGYANEINQYSFLPEQMHYDFCFNGIRKFKRKNFGKWPKAPKDEVVLMLQQYYQCNRKKAEQYLKLLNDDQLLEINKAMETGGY